MRKSDNASFTLVELLIVILIVGVIAALGIPGFQKARNTSLSKEGIANMRLIAAAERVYRMESDNNQYIACGDAATCNNTLKLGLNDNKWSYSVGLGGTGVATITATSTVQPACSYTLTSANFDANPAKAGGCTDGF